MSGCGMVKPGNSAAGQETSWWEAMMCGTGLAMPQPFGEAPQELPPPKDPASYEGFVPYSAMPVEATRTTSRAESSGELGTLPPSPSPSLPKATKENPVVSVQTSSSYGKQDRLQDRFSLHDVPDEHDHYLRAVVLCDGHNGSRAADFAARNLITYVSMSPKFNVVLGEALRHGVKRCADNILSKSLLEEWGDGTTVLALVVRRDRAHLATLGSSRAVLGRKRPGGEETSPERRRGRFFFGGSRRGSSRRTATSPSGASDCSSTESSVGGLDNRNPDTPGKWSRRPMLGLLSPRFIRSSRAVDLPSRYEPHWLSPDHTVENSTEASRARVAGAKIARTASEAKRWRMTKGMRLRREPQDLPLQMFPGGITSTRSLGDSYVKKKIPGALVEQAKIIDRRLLKDDHFIVLGSHSLWSCVTPQEACDEVQKAMESGHAETAARRLTSLAEGRGVVADVTAIVVLIDVGALSTRSILKPSADTPFQSRPSAAASASQQGSREGARAQLPGGSAKGVRFSKDLVDDGTEAQVKSRSTGSPAPPTGKDEQLQSESDLLDQEHAKLLGGLSEQISPVVDTGEYAGAWGAEETKADPQHAGEEWADRTSRSESWNQQRRVDEEGGGTMTGPSYSGRSSKRGRRGGAR